ncbi:MAG: sigma-54-dependent Fis family transcriptional regulator [Clostridia bacterium]|jgi:PAS domain S-box-containing protein|nr:sigma-54-dependent Fis family transcriptional regulator [Clostridia bacterium]
MGEQSLKRQGELKRLWKRFITGEEISDFPEPLIYESWQRCRQMKVDPDQTNANIVLTNRELRKLREKNRLLLQVSMPTLENLAGFVAGSGFAVALSDENGYLMEVSGDDNVRDAAQRGNWIAGASWSEASAGANVVGTAIYLDRPLSVIGYEHFCHCSHKWAGAGAPIHDSDGKIIGVVALAGTIDKAHAHSLGMVVAAANAIEVQLAMKKEWNASEMANQYKQIIMNSIYEGLLVTDGNGIITLVNKRAQEILYSPEEKLQGVHIRNLFSENFIRYLEKNLDKKQGQMIDVQEEIIIGDKKIKCTVTCRQIITNNHFSGFAIVINEISRAKKLVSKLLTQNARFTFDDIIGKNPKFCMTLKVAKTVAPRESNILLLGESGTGKDVFAQAIHNASLRRLGPFVAINCGAIPKELIGSELFGYAEGAFTGASKGGKMGKFELADGGTLFLDEIGEMPLEQQKALLRVLEEKWVSRIGGYDVIPVDVRIIAATNKDLQQEVKKGAFRQDLFYRLNVFAIKMVPLRERQEDIKLLASSFIEKFDRRQPPMEVPDSVWQLLYSYDWPGNVRELQNHLERALVLSDGKRLTCELFDLPQMNSRRSHPITSNLQHYEAAMLKDMLQQNGWNISKTSLELGISRTTLYRKMGLYRLTKSP